MRCLSVQNKKGGENSVKLGYYGNVETEQRMGGEGENQSVWEGVTAQRERETRKNYNTSETHLQFFMVQPFT